MSRDDCDSRRVFPPLEDVMKAVSNDLIYGPDEQGYKIELQIWSDNSVKLNLVSSSGEAIDSKNVSRKFIYFPKLQTFWINACISSLKKKANRLHFLKIQRESIRAQFAQQNTERLLLEAKKPTLDAASIMKAAGIDLSDFKLVIDSIRNRDKTVENPADKITENPVG